MKNRMLLMTVLSGWLLAGCDGPPKGTQQATVQTTSKTNAVVTVVPSGPVKVYKATDKSEFKYTGYKIVGKHSGTFIMFDASGKVPGGNLEQASCEVNIETMSTETDDDQLTRIMKTKDFFWCDEYPNMTFKSTRFEKEGDKYWITGDLALRGVTKSIRFPAQIAVTGDTLTIKAEFTVNRKWWNVIYQGIGDNVLKEDVLINLDLEAKEVPGA